MQTLAYEVVDVFTDRAYAGNPLAVVMDGDDLSTDQCRQIAREFNLSETTFPGSPTEAGADYRLRIFTPAELPFAGHPSVGSAWVLAKLGRLSRGRAVQECGAGLIPVEVDDDGARLSGGEPRVGDLLDPVAVAAVVGLTDDDLVDPPRVASVGLDFGYAHVRPDAVVRARPSAQRLGELPVTGGLSVFAQEGGEWHVRVFAGGLGWGEDPATGSAALGLGVWLAAAGLVPSGGETAYVINQGLEMGRPSRMACTVTTASGRAFATTVAGGVVPVARGEIRRP